MSAIQQLIMSYSLVTTTAITWDPTHKASNIALSNGNLTAAATTVGVQGNVLANVVITGQKYWEVTLTTLPTGSAFFDIGIARSSATISGGSLEGEICMELQPSSSIVVTFNHGVSSSSLLTTPVASYPVGTVIAIAIDVPNGKVWFGIASGGTVTWGKSTYIGNPATATNPTYSTNISGQTLLPALCLAVTSGQTAPVLTANFTSIGLTGSVPSGFSTFS